MSEIMWRFNGNNYNPDNGLETSNTEAFKQDPIASLARESCQNSIDARLGKKGVRIEFNTFSIPKENIPNRERLVQEIKSCIEFKKTKKNSKEKDQLEKMLKAIEKDKIHCLRISDFNTTGLTGVSTDEFDTPFYLLTKGSGITNKGSGSGGSKGIGKYASFVVSTFNTVFYSTLTKDGECGSIGICMLCSSTIEGTDEHTHGVGYYATSVKQTPALEQISLQPGYERTTEGTDIYILGFRNEETWKKEIISKVLDSFLCAVYAGDLEIKVDDININTKTLESIVYNDELITKSARSNIRSQYILLNDGSVYKETLTIGEYGDVKLYLKGFSKEERHLSTNKCVMVRQPLMKITDITNIASVPCSAMCVIPDGKLNDILRGVENPQHTDWYFNSIEDTTVRKEVRGVYKLLKDKILRAVQEKLAISDNDVTDIEGAGDYLPAVETGDNPGETEQIPADEPKIIKKVKNKVKEREGVYEDSEGQSLSPDIGKHEDGDGSPTPGGSNSGSGGTPHDTDDESGKDEDGDNEVLVIRELRGMQYIPFVIDKKEKRYAISFVSLYDEGNCDLEFYHLDDTGHKYKTNITKCTINGAPATIEDGIVKSFTLENKTKYKFEVDTDLDDLYTCEVKVYANRK